MPTVPTSPSTRIHSWSLVKRNMRPSSRDRSFRPVIAMGHEGQRRNPGGPRLAPGEPPPPARALRNGKLEARLDRGRALVDVVAVEAEPGLEAERIAGAEA